MAVLRQVCNDSIVSVREIGRSLSAGYDGAVQLLPQGFIAEEWEAIFRGEDSVNQNPGE